MIFARLVSSHIRAIAWSNYMYFTEIRSSVTDFREQSKMDVYCSFKVLVSEQCSCTRRDIM